MTSFMGKGDLRDFLGDLLAIVDKRNHSCIKVFLFTITKLCCFFTNPTSSSSLKMTKQKVLCKHQSVLSNSRPLPSSKTPHFQNEARCTTFLVKMSFICIRMKNDFHIKGRAPTLVLKQRPRGTWKWPITKSLVQSNCSENGTPIKYQVSFLCENILTIILTCEIICNMLSSHLKRSVFLRLHNKYCAFGSKKLLPVN